VHSKPQGRLTLSCKLKDSPSTITESNGADLLETEFLLELRGSSEDLWFSDLLAVPTYKGSKVEWFGTFLRRSKCIEIDDLAAEAVKGSAKQVS